MRPNPIPAAFFLALSCGGTEQPPDPQPAAPGASAERSGQRIKLQYVVSEDGARVARGLYDVQRQELCAFDTADDARLRCLPAAVELAAEVAFLRTDASCTRQVVAVPLWRPTPRYVRTSTRGIAPLSPFGGVLYYQSGPSCKLFGDLPTNYRYFVMEDAIPAVQFVAGTSE